MAVPSFPAKVMFCFAAVKMEAQDDVKSGMQRTHASNFAFFIFF